MPRVWPVGSRERAQVGPGEQLPWRNSKVAKAVCRWVPYLERGGGEILAALD